MQNREKIFCSFFYIDFTFYLSVYFLPFLGLSIKPQHVLVFDLPLDAMIPARPRTRTLSNSEVHCDDTSNQIFPSLKQQEQHGHIDGDIMTGTQNINLDVLLLSTEMRHHVIRADEALFDIILRAESMIVTPVERLAEYELASLARDKRYYDNISV
jgi:hypothetical protein